MVMESLKGKENIAMFLCANLPAMFAIGLTDRAQLWRIERTFSKCIVPLITAIGNKNVLRFGCKTFQNKEKKPLLVDICGETTKNCLQNTRL